MIDRFIIYADSDGSNRGDRHQQALVKGLPVPDPFKCLDQDIVADHKVRDHIENKSQNPGNRQKIKSDQQCRRYKDADQHLFLLFCHMSFPFF